MAAAERTITSILVNSLGLCTAHAGNVLRYWQYDEEALPNTKYEGALGPGVPAMEAASTGHGKGQAGMSLYKLKKVQESTP